MLQPGEAEQIPDSVTTGEDKHCAAEKEGKEGGESSVVSHVVDGELGNSNKKVATPSNEEKPSQYTHPNDLKEAQQEFDVRVKNKTRKNLDAARDMVQDTVRLWEPGWKERYYSDKCKVASVVLSSMHVHFIADKTYDRHTSQLIVIILPNLLTVYIV